MAVHTDTPTKFSIDPDRSVVLEPVRRLPVAKTADVIVAGGSPTGVCAAIAAARKGADTLLVERYGFLGGQMVAAMVPSPHRPHKTSEAEAGEESIIVEMLRRLVDTSGLKVSWQDVQNDPRMDVFINPEVSKQVLLQMVEEAGVKLLYHTFVADTIVEGGAVKGIVVENKAGRRALLGKVVVDATGDADIVARAGAPYKLRPVKERFGPSMHSLICNVDIAKTLQYLKAHPDQLMRSPRAADPISLEELEARTLQDQCLVHTHFQGFSDLLKRAAANGDIEKINFLQFMWLGRGIAMFSDFPKVKIGPIDCLNPDDVARAEGALRKLQWRKAAFFRKYVPGFENASLIETGVHIGVRETRTLVGEHLLRKEDTLASRLFEDTVIHFREVTGSLVFHFVTDHPARFRSAKMIETVCGDMNIPYRTLLPKKVDNLLVAGRCVCYSITPGALAGQVAGTAAALSAQAGVTPRKLDVSTLQRELVEQGFNYARLPSVSKGLP